MLPFYLKSHVHVSKKAYWVKGNKKPGNVQGTFPGAAADSWSYGEEGGT